MTNITVKKNMTLRELMKSNAVGEKSIPDKFPQDLSEKTVKEWSVLNDDEKNDKFDKRLVFQLEGERFNRSLGLKHDESIDKNERNNLFDKMSKGDADSENTYNKLVEKVFQITVNKEVSLER